MKVKITLDLNATTVNNLIAYGEKRGFAYEMKSDNKTRKKNGEYKRRFKRMIIERIIVDKFQEIMNKANEEAAVESTQTSETLTTA